MVDFSRLHDKEYRLNNLYYIVDRYGSNIKFEMNAVQRDVFRGMHTRNLILKARQLGMSSFSVLYLLDEAIFNYNISAGIVSFSSACPAYFQKNHRPCAYAYASRDRKSRHP